MAILGRSTLKRYYETGKGLSNQAFVATIDSIANLSDTTAQEFVSPIEAEGLVTPTVSAGEAFAQSLATTSARVSRLRHGVSAAASASDSKGFPIIFQQGTVRATSQFAFLPPGSSIVGMSFDALVPSSGAGGTELRMGDATTSDLYGSVVASGVGTWKITNTVASRLQNVSGAIYGAGVTSSAGGSFLAKIEYYQSNASAAPPAASLSFVASSEDTTNATSYSFTSISTGIPDPSRVVVVGIAGDSTTFAAISVSSVTIGGVTATKAGEQVDGGSVKVVSLWAAELPSGTTADIAVTFNTTSQRCAVAVWSLYNADPTSTGTQGSSVNPGSVTITLPARGLVIGFAFSNSNSTSTWTGLTEDVDDTIEAVNYTGASITSNTSQSLAAAVNYGGGPTREAAIFAAWGPA